MKNLTLRQKYLKLTGYGQTGGKYCNAIDEDIYDSTDWQNTMPPSGYSFTTLESGKVEVTYTNYFACFDGWDSMEDDSEYFNSLEIAINSIWIRNALDDVYDFIKALKHSNRVNIWYTDKDNRYPEHKRLEIDSTYYGDDYTRSYNPKEILSNLISNIYPTLKGKE